MMNPDALRVLAIRYPVEFTRDDLDLDTIARLARTNEAGALTEIAAAADRAAVACYEAADLHADCDDLDTGRQLRRDGHTHATRALTLRAAADVVGLV